MTGRLMGAVAEAAANLRSLNGTPTCQLCKVAGGKTIEYLGGRWAHEQCVEKAQLAAEAEHPAFLCEWPDGEFDDHVWVSVHGAPSKAVAIAKALEAFGDHLDDGMGFAAGERVWLRPAWVADHEDDPDSDQHIEHVNCEPSDFGAVEYWRLEVTSG